MKLVLALVLSILPPNLGFAQQTSIDQAEWLVVTSGEKSIGTVSVEHLAKVYLPNKRWKIVDPNHVPEEFQGGLFLLGDPRKNSLLAKHCAPLGLEVTSDGVVKWNGLDVPGGYGLILRGKTANQSPFTAFTGSNAEGVFACITVSTSVLSGTGHEFVQNKNKISAGEFRHRLVESKGVQFQNRTQIFRGDEVLRSFSQDGLLGSSGDDLFQLAKALSGYEWEYNRICSPPWDQTRPFFWNLRSLVVGSRVSLKKTLDRFDEVDLSKEIDQVNFQCVIALENQHWLAPSISIILAGAGDTNALTSGIDPVNKRPRIILNLSAMADLQAVRIAAAHEIVHTFQLQPDGTLNQDLFWLEGVASCVSQVLIEGAADHEALMWHKNQLAVAQKFHDVAVEEFLAARNAGGDRLKSWFIKGRSPARNNALPDRMGYYLGWYAAKKWLAADETRDLKDLMRTTPEQLLVLLKE